MDADEPTRTREKRLIEELAFLSGLSQEVIQTELSPHLSDSPELAPIDSLAALRRVMLRYLATFEDALEDDKD